MRNFLLCGIIMILFSFTSQLLAAGTTYIEAYSKGDYDLAISILTEQIVSKDIPEDKMEQLLSARGNIYFIKNNYIEALSDFEKILKLNPDNAKTYFDIGLIFEINRQYKRAGQYFDKAVALNADNLDYLFKAATIKRRLGKLDDALSDFTKGINAFPENASIFYGERAGVLFIKRKYNEAIEDYDKIVDINPNDPLAYYHRALAYDKIGKREKAIEDFTKSIELNPNYSKAYTERGKIYFERNKINEAIEDFTKAIEVDPKSAIAHYNRAIALKKKGEKEKANNDFIEAHKLDSNMMINHLIEE